MTRAAKMDMTLFEEAERDATLNEEAFRIVLMVAGAAGIGALLGGLLGGNLVGGIVLGIIQAALTVVMYYLWSWLVLQVGTKMFNGTSDMGEVRRTVAYAYTPNLAQVVSFVPVLGGLVAFVAGIWALVLGVVAVRQAMNFTTGTAVGTVIIAAVIALVIVGIIFTILSAILLVPLGLIGMMR
jgi:hypothetical protein